MIKWEKNIDEIHGWKMSPYEHEGGYISESGNWKIYRGGSFRYDKWQGEDIFLRDGDWIVENNNEWYAEFKTLKKAKEYVERWVTTNPEDYAKGGKLQDWKDEIIIDKDNKWGNGLNFIGL